MGNIDAEQVDSLLAMTDAASAALARGNNNDAKVVMNDMKALNNYVEGKMNIMPVNNLKIEYKYPKAFG